MIRQYNLSNTCTSGAFKSFCTKQELLVCLLYHLNREQQYCQSNEPYHEKTGFLPMRKQRP